MSDAAATQPLEPTQDERTYAVLAHALQMVGWWIAPLIIFIIHRRSRFVSFHALQALLWQIVLVLVYVVAGMIWFFTIFSFVFSAAAQGQKPGPPPTAFFVMFPLLWLGFFAIWGITLLLTILYAIKAGRGEWAGYPVLGNLARRILKF